MANTIPARPTTYKGIRMRSRLEALFAQHCDEIGLSWRYEPECFADHTGQYLPDFLVESGLEHAYVEVKPTHEAAIQALTERMPRVWSSDRTAFIVCAYPERMSYLETATWACQWEESYTTRNWANIALTIPFNVYLPDDHSFVAIDTASEHDRGVCIHLINNVLFDEAYSRHDLGQNGAWSGPPIPVVDGVSNLVAGDTPTSRWAPHLIELSDDGRTVLDCFGGQWFFMTPLVGHLLALMSCKHNY